MKTFYIIEFTQPYKIKLLYKVKVYDIKTQDKFNFVVKNVIVHNSIEQDADLVLMLYKEESTIQNLYYTQILDIIISKNRNGPIGSFQLLFHTNTGKFDNLTNTYNN